MKKHLYTLWFALTGLVAFAGTGNTSEPVTSHGISPASLSRIATIDSADSLVFDLSKATMSGSTVSFPVSILSDDTINSLDFSFKYDQTHLTYDSVQNLTAYIQPLAYYSAVDSTVRFTSFSLQPYAKGVSLVKVYFTLLAWQIDSADLNSIVGYLNGNICSVKLINSFPSGLPEISKNLFQLFPNPAKDRVTIEVTEKSTVQILDMAGRSIYFEEAIPATEKMEINTAGWSAGMYVVRVFNKHFVRVEKLVIE